MGKHMALNMLKSGVELIVNDVRTDSFEEFISKGASTTTDLSEVAKADIIFLSLPHKNCKGWPAGQKGLINTKERSDGGRPQHDNLREPGNSQTHGGAGCCLVDAVSGMEAGPLMVPLR